MEILCSPDYNIDAIELREDAMEEIKQMLLKAKFTPEQVNVLIHILYEAE